VPAYLSISFKSTNFYTLYNYKTTTSTLRLTLIYIKI